MSLFRLENQYLMLTVSSLGGSVLALRAKNTGEGVDLLRPCAQDEQTPAAQSGCFPLVPFGNRVKGNAFTYGGEHYRLQPNTADAHYLHGDGWLASWECLEHCAERLVLAFEHQDENYHYRAQQTFELRGSELMLSLAVTNLAAAPMPFGLGWHPFFPLSNDTLLTASTCGYWLEDTQFLSGQFQPVTPPELDFSTASTLPRHWVNNGLSGWDGRATVCWPAKCQRLHLTTTPPCPVLFLFLSDPEFDPEYCFDFFCIEPMSHAANAHHLPDIGGLVPLSQGESLTQNMRLRSEVALTDSLVS